MIICVTGLPGSGKSTVGKILKKKGFIPVEMGELVKEKMRNAGLETSGDKVRKFSIKIRKKYGAAILSKYAMEKIAPHIKRNKNVAVVGIRNSYEIELLKKKFKDVYLVGVFAPKTLRFERLSMRGRSDDSKSASRMEERDKQERNGYLTGSKGKRHGIETLLQLSDYMIFNTESQMKLYRNMNILISKIREAKAAK